MNSMVVPQVPEELDPAQELERIIEEYSVGTRLSELAMFRIWRMWSSGRFLDIIDAETGICVFSKWSDIVTYITDGTGCSRSKVYNRIKTYAMLFWAGYTEEEVFSMMLDKPGLYEKSLDKIVDWDSRNKEVRGLLVDSNGDDQGTIRRLIQDMSEYDTVSGSLSYLETDVLGEPEVELYFSEGKLVLFYQVSGDSNIVEFHPTSRVPSSIVSITSKKHKIGVSNGE